MSIIYQTLWVACTGMVFLWGSIASANEDGLSVLNRYHCNACHALTEAQSADAGLWRKGPALFYAGNKYNQQWVESWLQNPTPIRPTGSFYLDHVKPAPVRNVVRKHSLRPHAQLNEEEAKAVAVTLSGMKGHSDLVKNESFQSDGSLIPAGEMLFEKVYGCMSCHRVEPNYGGMSGPEMYTAGKRLSPRFMLSYMRNPQAWEPKSWMPNKHVSADNMQKIVNYLIDLSKENFDE